MSVIVEFFNTIWYYKELIGTIVTVVLVAKVTWDLTKGWRFITSVLPDLRAGEAIRKMLLAIWHAPLLILEIQGERLAAARFVTELEILKPAAKKPLPQDYS